MQMANAAKCIPGSTQHFGNERMCRARLVSNTDPAWHDQKQSKQIRERHSKEHEHGRRGTPTPLSMRTDVGACLPLYLGEEMMACLVLECHYDCQFEVREAAGPTDASCLHVGNRTNR